MRTRSGAHALVESLQAEGVSTLFGIPGVGTLAVYDAFLDHPSLDGYGHSLQRQRPRTSRR